MVFHDRKNEQIELHEILHSNNFEFLVLYGRRRVGKTELILQAIKKRRAIYYFSVGANNLERFYKTCIQFDPHIATLKMDFEVILTYLKDKIDVLVIDEFQEMIKEDKNVLHIFQACIDTQLQKSTLKLILLGSSVSLLNSQVLSYQSPLYGRKTYSIKLKPISFFDLHEFYPNYAIEDLVEIYGFADGIPYYLIKINSPLWSFIQKELTYERGFLKDEVDFIMKYEFEDTNTYKLILEAIAHGKTKLGEIKDFIKVRRTDLGPYLRNLIDVDFISRSVPITENSNSREGRYYIKDNFMRFWFRYIYPNLSAIESKAFPIEAIKDTYSHYLGIIFEKICQEFLVKTKIFSFTKIGKWWHKETEIDFVALNERTGDMLFAECKWGANVNAIDLAKHLFEKTRVVRWQNESRTEHLVLFAKSFAKKISKYQGKKVYCFDLHDLEKQMR